MKVFKLKFFKLFNFKFVVLKVNNFRNSVDYWHIIKFLFFNFEFDSEVEQLLVNSWSIKTTKKSKDYLNNFILQSLDKLF